MPTRRNSLERNIAINNMVGELIRDLDEDLWKSFFVKEYEEEEGAGKETRKRLRGIVERHLPLIEEATNPTASVGTGATVAEATCGNPQGGGVSCGGYYGDGGNTY